jgi:hypothetical protein
MGYEVQAIDPDPEAVSAALKRGVPATVAEWPDFTAPSPEAIVLVRVLHHLDDIETALDRYQAALPPAGRLLVEDSAFGDMPGWARAWFETWVERTSRAALFSTKLHPFVAAVLHGEDPSDQECVHSVAEMESALRAHFQLQFREPAPYFYRYISESVLESPAACDLVHSMLENEKSALKENRLWPLGRRWVGVRVG